MAVERGEPVADPDADDPAESAARNDARRRLAEALSALPERRRELGLEWLAAWVRYPARSSVAAS